MDSLEVEIKPEQLNLSTDISPTTNGDTEQDHQPHAVVEPSNNSSEDVSCTTSQSKGTFMASTPLDGATCELSPASDTPEESSVLVRQMEPGVAEPCTGTESAIVTGTRKPSGGILSGLVSGSDSHSAPSSQQDCPVASAAELKLRRLCDRLNSLLAQLPTLPAATAVSQLRTSLLAARHQLDILVDSLPGAEGQQLSLTDTLVVPETPEHEAPTENGDTICNSGDSDVVTSPPADAETETKAPVGSFADTGQCVDRAAGDLPNGGGASVDPLEDTTMVWEEPANDDAGDSMNENERARLALLMSPSDESEATSDNDRQDGGSSPLQPAAEAPSDRDSPSRDASASSRSSSNSKERNRSKLRPARTTATPQADDESEDSDSSADLRRPSRRGVRRGKGDARRCRQGPRGPPQPSEDCSVVVVRLSADMVQQAEERGSVTVSRRVSRKLSQQELEVRRLANIAVLLRSPAGKKLLQVSDGSDTDASQNSARRSSRPSRSKRTVRQSRRVKDMSSAEEDAASASDTSPVAVAGPSGLVPEQQNSFDRLQLLASDSRSDDSPSEDDNDSDFVPEKIKDRRQKKEVSEEYNPDNKKSKLLGSKNKRKRTDSSNSSDKGKSEDGTDKVKNEKNDTDSDVENSKAKSPEKKKQKKGSDADASGSVSEEGPATAGPAEEDEDVAGAKRGGKAVGGRVKKLLKCKLSATDSSEEDEKMKDKLRAKKEAKAEEEPKENGETDSEQSADVEPTETVTLESSEEDVKKKKRSPGKRRLRLANSDSSDVAVLSDSDGDEASKKYSPSASSSSSSSDGSSDDFTEPKKTRSRQRLKRVRRMSDDSVSTSGSDGDDDDAKPSSQSTPGKGGRKKIRHIREAELTTKQASQAEQARRKRIEEKQTKLNELLEKEEEDETPTRLVLDFDEEAKKPLVSVHKNFVKILKPHQIDGVKFMFDATVETVSRLYDETNVESAGCILAHCMGLGKTLQVVVLLHTLLSNSETRGKMTCGLVVCPKSTVQNWVRELKTWQKKCRVPAVDVIDITFKKDNYERSFELEEWAKEGGVCVLSYDMFKRFAGNGGKKGYNKKQKDRFQHALVDPGPDFVVCDEGHLLKNPRTAAFKSLNQMKCVRRVVLTGTPLQNNLREYHTMVEFVKPRLLGSESEFSNRFIRPIENGSAVDAQPRDVKLMKRRSHVLHKLLDAVVQRRDYNVLTPFLPAKHEYTVLVKLGEVQRRLYQLYLDRAAGASTRRILSDFQALSRIWSHPRCVQMKDEQDEEANDLKQEKLAMEKFVANDSETSEEDDNSNDATENGTGSPSAGDPKAEEEEWWRSCVPEDVDLDDVTLSGKLSLLDELLIKCENIGDKLLVFSQSLFSLNLIEEHLARLHKEMQKRRNSEKKHRAHVYFGTWRPDYDYFRLDGSTPSEARQQMCDRINKASNERARLMLISTKAGGLGINLVGANRVVIFDASWNPTADSQAIFRVFRFGQVKPCFIYRFITQGCMEEKIYDRQISKLSLACRVVDEQQVERHFNAHDVEELYEFEPDRKRETGLVVPKDDRLLMELVSEQSDWVSSVHGHDSLLQNVEEEELNADEQRAAWEEYENDRRGLPNVGDVIPLVDGKTIEKAAVIQMIKKDNPGATDNEVLLMIPRAIQTLRAYYFKKQQEEQRQQEQQYFRLLQQQRQNQMAMQRGAYAGGLTGDSTYAQLMRQMAMARGQMQAPATTGDDRATKQLHNQLLQRMLQTSEQHQKRQQQQQQQQQQAGAGRSRPRETFAPRQRTAHKPQMPHKPQLPRVDVQLPGNLQITSVNPTKKDEEKPEEPPAVVDIA